MSAVEEDLSKEPLADSKDKHGETKACSDHHRNGQGALTLGEVLR
ncbi:MAG: hypothetical protein ACSLEW_14160 [Nocardioides sp.]